MSRHEGAGNEGPPFMHVRQLSSCAQHTVPRSIQCSHAAHHASHSPPWAGKLGS